MTKLINEKGFTEISISEKREFEDFFKFAEKLKQSIKIDYIEKIDDFDSLYWIFEYEKSIMVVSYNTFLGISIYPRNTKKASVIDNQLIIKINDLIKNW